MGKKSCSIMPFRKNELKFLWPFYLNVFVFGIAAMVTPFMAVYYIHLGFSYFQISIITSSFALSTFLFEIPTGAFADGFGRKYSVIVGYLIGGTAISLIPFVSDFYVMVILWAIAGFGLTFSSGAEDAWVIDNLNKQERIDLYQEYFIKSLSFRAFGAVAAPMIGAILVSSFSIEILWYIYGFGYFFCAIILLLFTKELFKPQKFDWQQLIQTTFSTGKKGVVFFFRNKMIFLFSLAGVFTYLMSAASAAHQPFFLSLGMPDYQLGYLFSAIGIISVIIPFISRLIGKSKPKNILSITILLRVTFQFSFFFIYPPFFLIASILFATNKGISMFESPINQTYLHKLIPGRIRATAFSAISMVTSLTMILSSTIAGSLLDVYGPRRVIAIMGLFGVFAIIIYQRYMD